jgi:hypothetical protein
MSGGGADGRDEQGRDGSARVWAAVLLAWVVTAVAVAMTVAVVLRDSGPVARLVLALCAVVLTAFCGAAAWTLTSAVRGSKPR